MSWVFLAGDKVYKLKKPVRFPYLDFSTPRRREDACRAELSLNRRLAADVYLDVVPLTTMEEFADHMEAADGAGVSVTIIDIVKQLARLFHDGEPKWGFVPDKQKYIAELFYQFTQSGGDQLDRFVSTDMRYGTVITLFKGVPISKPSDNPTGIAMSLALKRQQAANTQYAGNAQDASNWLTAANGGYEVELIDGEDGVSPGQACVFYDAGEAQARVLGGGFIKSAVAAADRTRADDEPMTAAVRG